MVDVDILFHSSEVYTSSPIPTRRQFFGVAALAALSYPLRGLADDQEKPQSVNHRGADIAKALREYKEIASVTEHFRKDAEQCLVHWEWAHFREDLNEEDLPVTETCQAELYPAFDRAMDDETVRLDHLFTEGFIEGREKQLIAERIRMMRSALYSRMEIVVPFGVSNIAPSPERVKAGMRDPKELLIPTNQLFYPRLWNGERRQLKASPMAVAGVGTALHSIRSLPILATEDPVIDRNADRAEASGNKEEFKKWVHVERNKHMVKLVRESKRDIAHLLCGYAHDFSEETEVHNISLLVVTPKCIRKARDQTSKEKPRS